jgi:hypothetical protein
MKEDKLYELLEQSIRAQENSANTQISINKAIEELNKNTKALNDNFVLHCTDQTEITRELKLIKDHLLTWIKWLLTVLIGVLSVLAGIKQITELL